MVKVRQSRSAPVVCAEERQAMTSIAQLRKQRDLAHEQYSWAWEMVGASPMGLAARASFLQAEKALQEAIATASKRGK